MTADITRNFADRAKHFSGLQRQQGRIPTDAEENAADEIARRSHETAFSETICPLGSPDNGFKIGTLNPAGPDFQILGGTYYLGGTRVENSATINYSAQSSGNWLTKSPTDKPAAGAKVFVWLEAMDQTVSAVDDGELAEPALRGPDGAARSRMGWRVRQGAVTASTCAAAMQEALGATVFAARNPLTGAIEPSGTMAVGFTTTGVDTDLCKPATTPGYLGNRNRTYRVKVSSSGRFVWGVDNASQLFRVVIGSDNQTLTFLNFPKDEFQRPRAGMTVELLRPDVLLPNLEKPGEAHGLLLKVATGYADKKITVSADPGIAPIATWLAALPASMFADATAPRFVYARIWTGGGESGAVDAPFVSGTAKTLGATGLTVTFNGTILPGSSWTFSARPDAPTRVLPWAMRAGMTAHGPRRHIAPLGIIDFTAGTVHHCREQFRPLWRMEDCCSITVGDGESSYGDFQSIADAVAALPVEGGCICLLPGRHRGNITITGRRNIKFTGCAGRTFWSETNAANPLVTLTGCKDIAFVGIEMSNSSRCCILADKATVGPVTPDVGGLVVENCRLIVPNGWALSASRQSGVRISDCKIVAGPLASRNSSDPVQSLAAVFLQGDDLLVEGCKIVAPLPATAAEQLRALGGLHIGGASRRIVIRGNIIDNGAGMGIMLGTVHDVTTTVTGPFGWAIATGIHYTVSSQGCIIITYFPPGGGGSTTTTTKHSDGEIVDVRIGNNDIMNMGSNGIGSFPMILIGEDGTPAEDAVIVSRLEVFENRIAACLRYEPPALGPVAQVFTPRGGVALGMVSDCLFRANRIFNNGPGGYASCGIGITYGEDLRLFENQIESNNRYSATRVSDGPDSGVDILLAVGGLATLAEGGEIGGPAITTTSGGGSGGITGLDDFNGPVGGIHPRSVDRAALQMMGNTIYQPAGRALRTMGLGPMMITDNHMTGGNVSRLFSRGFAELTKLDAVIDGMSGDNDAQKFLYQIVSFFDLAGGDAIQVVNLGPPKDIFWQYFAANSPATGAHANPMRRGAGMVNLVTFFTVMAGGGHSLAPIVQRGGLVMIDNNQIFLQQPKPDGPEGSLSSILVLTLDDLNFADNQIGVDLNRIFVVFDALLMAMSLRVTANRAQEAAFCWSSIQAIAFTAAFCTHNHTTFHIGVSGDVEEFDEPNFSVF